MFGNRQPEVLAHFNFDSNTTILSDIRSFMSNSRLLSLKLKEAPNVEDRWNKALLIYIMRIKIF